MGKISSKLMLGEVGPRVQGLQNLFRRELPARAAFRLGKIMKPLSEEAKAYEEARMDLVKKYSDKDKQGNPATKDGVYQFSPKNKAVFDKEHAELFETEITVEAAPIHIDDFKDVAVSASELLLLGDFLVED